MRICRGWGAPVLAAIVISGTSGCSPEPSPYLDLIESEALGNRSSLPAEVDFGTESARSLLDQGWSTQEERWAGGSTFAWATSVASTIRFRSFGADVRALRFRCRASESPDDSPQTVTLLLNGTNLGIVELSPGFQVYRVELPDGALFAGDNELEFRYAYLSERQPDDSRARAVAWDWLRFAPTPEARSDPPSAAEGGLFLPIETRLDYYYDLREDTSLRLEADAGINHPRAKLLVEAIGERVGSVSAEISGEELATGLDLTMPHGPVRVSLRVLSDPGNRGVVLRRAVMQAPDAGRIAAAKPPPPNDFAASDEAPNIIVYLVDTLRADHLGVYGYEKPTSPALDAMAEEGAVFERAFAQSSWTRTSVASLMTGLSPNVHGVLGRDDSMPAEAITLQGLLSDLGYQTYAAVTNGNVSQAFGLNSGFDVFRYLAEQPPAVNPEVHQLSDDVNDEFLGWLDQRDSARPFFAYLHTSDPHAPYTPRTPHLESFLGQGPRTGVVWPRLAKAFAERRDSVTAAALRDELVTLYDAEIAFNDKQFGLLLDALGQRGLADRTIVVFTSDHGEEFLDHGDYGHGRVLYRELIQIPLVIRLPTAVGAGTRPRATAQLTDLLPTLIQLAGGQAPSWAQGRSLVPALHDAGWDDGAAARAYLQLDTQSSASYVQGDFHLLRRPMSSNLGGTTVLRLFDLGQDFAEQTNLHHARDIRAGLLLAQWRQHEAEDMPLLNAGTAEVDEELAARLRDLGYIR